jgi:hypothetical protein
MKTFHYYFYQVYAKMFDRDSNLFKTTNAIYNEYHLCDALYKFARNSKYWSRYSYTFTPIRNEKIIKQKNYKKKVKNKDYVISGKYLNEIHIKLTERGFYKELQMMILNDYLEYTEYKTLEHQSSDSMFLRSAFSEASRNPKNANHPGCHLHFRSDSIRTPLAFFLTDSNESDSIHIKKSSFRKK